MTLTMVGASIVSIIKYNGPPPIEKIISKNTYDKSLIDSNSTDIAINMINKLSNIEILITCFTLFVMGISGNSVCIIYCI